MRLFNEASFITKFTSFIIQILTWSVKNKVYVWIAENLLCLCFTFLFLFLEARSSTFERFQWVSCIVHGTHKHLFFNQTFIKNGSYGTIYTFKNYFATIFSIFNKISSIQTNPKCVCLPFLEKQCRAQT